MRLGVVGDLHWAAGATGDRAWHNPYDFAGLGDRLMAAAGWFRDAGADAVAVLADVANVGDDAALRRPLELLLAAGVPLLVVPGNHDVGVAADGLARAAAPLGDELHVAPFARRLDGLVALGVGLASEDGGLTAHGVLPALPPGRAVRVVLSHYPLVSQALALAEQGFAHPGDLLNRAALEDGLRDGPAVVLHGHLHARVVACRDGVLQLGVAALVEHPAEAALLELAEDDAGLVVRLQPRSLAALPHRRTPVLTAQRAWRFDGGRWRDADG